MKKTILVLLLLIMNLGFTQPKQDKFDKIKSLKVAHITESLELSSAEAEKFWPIFHSLEEEKMSVLKQMHQIRRKSKSEDISETQASDLLKQYKSVEVKMSNINQKFIDELSGIISSKKILKLIHLQASFKERLRGMMHDKHKRH